MKAEPHHRLKGVVLDAPETAPSPFLLRLSDEDRRSISTEPICNHTEKHDIVSVNSPDFTSAVAEEFSTILWVRCRSRAQSTDHAEPQSLSKSREIIYVETICDISTWQWVCNHNHRIVPV
jgi:hypothetical protein